MPITDNDLRSLLAERSAAVPPNVPPQRLAGVQSRVRRTKQRRAAAGSLAAVLLVAGVALAPGLFEGRERKAAPIPAHQQKVAGGLLPRYAQGGEATAYTVFDTDKIREKSFTFTPQQWGFHMEVNCDERMPDTHMVSVELNGKARIFGSCIGGGFNIDAPTSEEERSEGYGIRIGQPVTVTARVIATPDAFLDNDNDNRNVVVVGANPEIEKEPTYTGPLASYRVAVAAYSLMDRADYPFPPRPEKLLSFDGTSSVGSGDVIGTVDSRVVGANGDGLVEFRLPSKNASVDLFAVAPGTLSVSVNDVVVHEFSHWSWTAGGSGLHLTPELLAERGVQVQIGDPLRVRVAATNFSDEGWKAEVREGETSGWVYNVD